MQMPPKLHGLDGVMYPHYPFVTDLVPLRKHERLYAPPPLKCPTVLRRVAVVFVFSHLLDERQQVVETVVPMSARLA